MANPKPTVGVQLYVFHQLYARKQQNVADHMDEVFADVAAAGISHVESGFNYTETPEAAAGLKTLLDKHGLKLCSLYGTAGAGVFHVADQAEADIEATLARVQLAKDIGCPQISFNPAPKPQQAAKTEQELQTQVKYLDQLGRALAEQGLRLGLHNHTPAALRNCREIRYNAAHTDPRCVGFCLDTHWVLRGGADPIELLDELGERVVALHVRNSADGVWMEDFGDGDIDHRKIADWVERVGFAGPLIIELAYDPETKITRSIRENLARSRAYVREVFGV